jgi:predicted PolB exonuclease-like 3'-5' exonuclease
MRKIVFDIETCGCEMKDLSESQQEYLLREALKESDPEIREQKSQDAERFLSLYPLTAKVVAIGMYDVTKEKVLVYYENENSEEWQAEDKPAFYKGMNEAEMIQKFWEIADKVDQVITFNGRNFDIPFLMMRSALLKIKPAKNFLGYRYDTKTHIDLLEQFTFYGITRKFNLDFYCYAFGIKSPKSKEVSGMEVKNLYEAGRIKEIAVYCGEDVTATYKLYKIWDEFLNFKQT